jgi:hypothetical protein
VRIVIEGRSLPGRHFAEHDNVHVALQVRSDPEGPVRGDAPSARWETVVRRVDGDVRGPAVHGRRGERFLYLTWGDPHGDDWSMFRRAKLMLDPVLAPLGDDVELLTAAVDLTDSSGGPRCARLAPPDVVWTAQASGARSL